ncbi:MAG TPA: response regulator [Thiothrix sp.]|nr:response regulator [Thiothrix sp.]
MLCALVIDDSSAIRKQLELELRISKVAADFAESGEQALEKVKQRQFDLIFLDIMMPGIDGYETCKLIRANTEYKKTPIIMLSGKTSPLDEVQGIIAGATSYLTKPVKSADFQKVLARVTAWVTNFKAEEQKKKQLLNRVT